jgi:hypothetical protein
VLAETLHTPSFELPYVHDPGTSGPTTRDHMHPHRLGARVESLCAPTADDRLDRVLAESRNAAHPYGRIARRTRIQCWVAIPDTPSKERVPQHIGDGCATGRAPPQRPQREADRGNKGRATDFGDDKAALGSRDGCCIGNFGANSTHRRSSTTPSHVSSGRPKKSMYACN